MNRSSRTFSLFSSASLWIPILISMASSALFFRHIELPFGYTHDHYGNLLNAYCLQTFLVDEFGTFLPTALRNFGDYKPPLYAALMGLFLPGPALNLASARLLGLIAVWLSGVVLLFFLWLRGRDLLTQLPLPLALLATTSLWLSPWFFALPRSGVEPLLCPLYFGLLLWTVWRRFDSGGLFTPRPLIQELALAFLCGLGMYVYQGTKLYSALGIFYFALSWYRHRRNTQLMALALTIILYALPFIQLGPTAVFARFQVVKGFAFNPFVFTKNLILQGWSPSYLFWEGPRINLFDTTYYGLWSRFWALPFYLGWIRLFYGVYRKQRPHQILSALYLLAILPAALTRDEIPHGARGATAILPCFLVFLVGLDAIYGFIQERIRFNGFYRPFFAALGPIALLIACLSDEAKGWRHFLDKSDSLQQWQHYPGRSDIIQRSEAWLDHTPDTVVQRFEEAKRTGDPRYCGLGLGPEGSRTHR